MKLKSSLAISIAGNNNQTEQHTVPKTTSTPAPAKLAPQPTKAADKTSITHTIPIHTTTNNHTNTTSTPKQDAQTSSTTAAPTQKSTTEQSTVAPNVGDVSQSDDSSGTVKVNAEYQTVFIEVDENVLYYVAETASGQNEANAVSCWLAP